MSEMRTYHRDPHPTGAAVTTPDDYLRVHIPGDRDTWTRECHEALVGQDRVIVAFCSWRLEHIVAQCTITSAGAAADGGLDLTLRLDLVDRAKLTAFLSMCVEDTPGRYDVAARYHLLDGDTNDDGSRVYRNVRLYELTPHLQPEERELSRG